MYFKSIVFLLTALFSINILLPVNATDPDKALRDDMRADGYVPIKSAVKEFEAKSNLKVKLPKVPFNANHKVGKIAGDKKLILKWMDTKANHTKSFWMFVAPAENKLMNADKDKDEVVKLNDGTVAYFSDYHYYKLVFHKDNLEYCINHDAVNITKKEFIEIAESI